MASDQEDGNLPAGVRRQQIVSIVRDHRFVGVSELSSRFGVSEVTVRNDLVSLERSGQVRRVRGGAVMTEARAEQPYELTASEHVAEKLAIARLAVELVKSGDSVLLDVGSTATAIAAELVERRQLQRVVVITYGLNVAMTLEAAYPRIEVVVTGGAVRPTQHSLVGPLSSRVIEELHCDTAFIACTGVATGAGFTNVNLVEAQVKKAMLAAAARRVFVADASKVGRTTLASFARLDEADLLITTPGGDPQTLEALRERGVEVLVAEPEQPSRPDS
jgi:DeoR family transcriptional regulator of aga operon